MSEAAIIPLSSYLLEPVQPCMHERRHEVEVLDHGFVRLVDSMGDDMAVVEAARISYRKTADTVTPTKEEAEKAVKLIFSLMSRGHTSPFEMVELKFHVKLPLFVARQWIRHRTANVNEASARFTAMCHDTYCPEIVRTQHATEKQMGGEIHPDQAAIVQTIHDSNATTQAEYKEFLSFNVANETARTVVNLNAYTEMYWKIDLHNLLHFIHLREDRHAQPEIQYYASALKSILDTIVPVCMRAFEEYYVHGARLSRTQIAYLRDILHGTNSTAFTGHKLSMREMKDAITLFGLQEKDSQHA